MNKKLFKGTFQGIDKPIFVHAVSDKQAKLLMLNRIADMLGLNKEQGMGKLRGKYKDSTKGNSGNWTLDIVSNESIVSFKTFINEWKDLGYLEKFEMGKNTVYVNPSETFIKKSVRYNQVRLLILPDYENNIDSKVYLFNPEELHSWVFEHLAASLHEDTVMFGLICDVEEELLFTHKYRGRPYVSFYNNVDDDKRLEVLLKKLKTLNIEKILGDNVAANDVAELQRYFDRLTLEKLKEI